MVFCLIGPTIFCFLAQCLAQNSDKHLLFLLTFVYSTLLFTVFPYKNYIKSSELADLRCHCSCACFKGKDTNLENLSAFARSHNQ